LGGKRMTNYQGIPIEEIEPETVKIISSEVKK